MAAGGAIPPNGRSSRTYVHNRPVIVLPFASTGVIAMNALGRQHMISDQRHQRTQRRCAGPHPVRQRGDIEIDPLAGIHLALAIERLVIAELGVQDHREQVGTRAATGDRMERRAGGWAIVSQARHTNFSRTVWITFHWRGTLSRVSVTVSPSLDRVPPHQEHAVGPGMTTRSRGRCAGRGPRTGLRRVKLLTKQRAPGPRGPWRNRGCFGCPRSN